MTLPSRKKHPTTVRRSIKQARTDRPHRSRSSLARLLRWGLCISVALTSLGLLLPCASNRASAQNPLTQNPLTQNPSAQSPSSLQRVNQAPAWAPTPFQANPLRENLTPAKSFEAPIESTSRPQSSANAVTKQSEVLRWRKVEQPTNRLQPSIRRGIASKYEPTVAPEVTSAAYQDPSPSRPQPVRSSLLIQQPTEPTVKALPELPVEPVLIPSRESSVLPQAPAPLVIPAIPGPQSIPQEPPALAIPATPAPLTIPAAPPALAIPAAPPALTIPAAPAPLTIPAAPPELAIPPVPRKLPEPPESVLPDPSSALPNPFPKSSGTQEPLSSPSDRTLREPAKLDEDSPPEPPKRANQSVANCDLVRDFAAGADIRNFRLDSSPDFVQVYQNTDRTGALTKENFVNKSPMRTWRGEQGEYIAEGKLVDYVYGTVVLEQSDGKRVSYLQRKLSDADQVFVSEAWGVPVTCPLGDQGFAPRFFVDSTFTWKASGACNKPLYFEDVALERYGHEWGPLVTPVVSTVRFFGDLAVLPYKMGIHPPNECQHPLGYYRPGSCAPWSIGPVPLSMRGAVTQAAFVTGTALALP